MRLRFLGLAAAILLVGLGLWLFRVHPATGVATKRVQPVTVGIEAADEPSRPFLPGVDYRPHRIVLDPSGFGAVEYLVSPWKPEATLAEIAGRWDRLGYRGIEDADRRLSDPKLTRQDKVSLLYVKANLLNYEGEAEEGYRVLERLRPIVEQDQRLARRVSRDA